MIYNYSNFGANSYFFLVLFSSISDFKNLCFKFVLIYKKFTTNLKHDLMAIYVFYQIFIK